MPIHDVSTFAAVSATPRCMTAGKVQPIGPGRVEVGDDLADDLGDVPGDPPGGVGMRSRSAARLAGSRSTGAPLMPVPPMSMPRIVVMVSSLPRAGRRM